MCYFSNKNDMLINLLKGDLFLLTRFIQFEEFSSNPIF